MLLAQIEKERIDCIKDIKQLLSEGLLENPVEDHDIYKALKNLNIIEDPTKVNFLDKR